MVNVCLFAMMIPSTKQSSVSLKTGFWSVCRKKAPATHEHRPVKTTHTAVGSFFSDPADRSTHISCNETIFAGRPNSLQFWPSPQMHKGRVIWNRLDFRDLENDQDISPANAYCKPKHVLALISVYPSIYLHCTFHRFHLTCFKASLRSSTQLVSRGGPVRVLPLGETRWAYA